MKKLLLPVLFAALTSSCGEGGDLSETDSSNFLEEFSFSTDTVMVDSGDELLNLRRGMDLADVSRDRKTLYLFNDTDQTLSTVDLDGLKISGKTHFEKEGPNGTGQYIAGIQSLSDERILIISFQNNGIFNLQGQKELPIKLESAKIDSLTSELESNAAQDLMVADDRSKAYSIPGTFWQGERGFLIASIPDFTGKVTRLPELDRLSSFTIIYYSNDGSSTAYMGELGLQEVNGEVVLWNSGGSSVYLIDTQTDSISEKTFVHQLVATRKEGSVKQKVSSMDEFRSEMAKVSSQINFNEFLWDDSRQMYFRFGSVFLANADEDASSRLDVFLFAYDDEMNLVGEKKIEELKAVPELPFFKDGKLWSYVNVEDELGFAVMDFKF